MSNFVYVAWVNECECAEWSVLVCKLVGLLYVHVFVYANNVSVCVSLCTCV